jgi:hypothetical protein
VKDRIRVNFGGDILDVPIADFKNPKHLAWWGMERFSGSDPVWDARCSVGYRIYRAMTGDPIIKKIIPVYYRGKLRFKIRCVLTKLGVI